MIGLSALLVVALILSIFVCILIARIIIIRHNGKNSHVPEYASAAIIQLKEPEPPVLPPRTHRMISNDSGYTDDLSSMDTTTTDTAKFRDSTTNQSSLNTARNDKNKCSPHLLSKQPHVVRVNSSEVQSKASDGSQNNSSNIQHPASFTQDTKEEEIPSSDLSGEISVPNANNTMSDSLYEELPNSTYDTYCPYDTYSPYEELPYTSVYDTLPCDHSPNNNPA